MARLSVMASACIAAAALLAGGCSSGSGLTTGSLFGSSSAPVAEAAPQPTNDPTTRAFQVGSTAARAVKCGYNFDPVAMRTNFLAAESATLAPADLARVEKVYDTAFNGVAKAVAAEPDYCTAEKTKTIKENLTRHLAGDYSPAQVKQVAKPADDGWFSNWGGSGPDSGPKFGSGDWWDKQRDAIGG